MTHQSLRLCAILGTTGIALTVLALVAAGAAAWDAARSGRLPTLSWGPAR